MADDYTKEENDFVLSHPIYIETFDELQAALAEAEEYKRGIEELGQQHGELEKRVEAAQGQLSSLDADYRAALAEHERQRESYERQHGRLTEENSHLRQLLEEKTTGQETLEASLRERAELEEQRTQLTNERSHLERELEASLRQRTELEKVNDQLARDRASLEQEIQHYRTREAQRLHGAKLLAAETSKLQAAHEERGRELEAYRRYAADLERRLRREGGSTAETPAIAPTDIRPVELVVEEPSPEGRRHTGANLWQRLTGKGRSLLKNFDDTTQQLDGEAYSGQFALARAAARAGTAISAALRDSYAYLRSKPQALRKSNRKSAEVTEAIGRERDQGQPPSGPSSYDRTQKPQVGFRMEGPYAQRGTAQPLPDAGTQRHYRPELSRSAEPVDIARLFGRHFTDAVDKDPYGVLIGCRSTGLLPGQVAELRGHICRIWRDSDTKPEGVLTFLEGLQAEQSEQFGKLSRLWKEGELESRMEELYARTKA